MLYFNRTFEIKGKLSILRRKMDTKKRKLMRYVRKRGWSALCRITRRKLAPRLGDNFPAFAMK